MTEAWKNQIICIFLSHAQLIFNTTINHYMVSSMRFYALQNHGFWGVVISMNGGRDYHWCYCFYCIISIPMIIAVIIITILTVIAITVIMDDNDNADDDSVDHDILSPARSEFRCHNHKYPVHSSAWNANVTTTKKKSRILDIDLITTP